MASDMKSRNRMTLRQLIIRQNSELFYSDDKTAFSCGEIVGYISPKVRLTIETPDIDKIVYAECQKPGEETWVPCLMTLGGFTNSSKINYGELLH